MRGRSAWGWLFISFGLPWCRSRGSFVIVGMAGFFAAAAKTPISTLIIVSEMTGGYHLLLPALWVCVLAFLLSDEQSIYANQIETRSRSPAHQGSFVRDLVGTVYVREFLVREQVFQTVHAADTLMTVLDRLGESRYPVLPVVDPHNRLLGVIDLEEAHQAGYAGNLAPLLVAADLMRSDVRPLTPDESLDRRRNSSWKTTCWPCRLSPICRSGR